MITISIRENEEFIKLGQALKKASVVGEGAVSFCCWDFCGARRGTGFGCVGWEGFALPVPCIRVGCVSYGHVGYVG